MLVVTDNFIFTIIHSLNEKANMQFPHSYYLFKHIYIVSLSVYLSISSTKTIDTNVSKTYRPSIIETGNINILFFEHIQQFINEHI